MWCASALVTAALMGFAGPHTPAFDEAWSSSIQAQWVERLRPVEAPHDGGEGRVSLIEIEYAPWMLHWRGHETELPSAPKWIEHRVIPRERLSQIAARYGVTVDQLEMWNRGRLSRGLRKGTGLRVLARRIPPPQELVTYEVGPDEGWGDIAHRFRVEPRDLKAVAGLRPARPPRKWRSSLGNRRRAAKPGVSILPCVLELVGSAQDSVRKVGRTI